jgi:RNA polymerase sigma-70 factor, ECF subfamily
MEDDVLQLVRSGRPDAAFERVLREYRRRIFGLAFSYLRNRAAAEDLAQEVFIKVWKALPAFDGRSSLATWIYAITRNTSISALRARREPCSLNDPDILACVESASPVPSEDAELERESLLRLVDALPVKQRQAVILFYMEERSHEEVSAMLAMPVGTVKTLLHRARARLSASAGELKAS